ncbi:hypothetical protein FRC01_006873 [Tulasnella sp. 417]|nr:hypothetical protein FRC01_006873 [Tulasnella sp. 417]
MSSENDQPIDNPTGPTKRKYGNDAYGRKKPRTKQNRTEADIWRDRVTAHGRAIGRDADAFSLPRHVIDTGIETDDEDEIEDSNTDQPSPEQRIWKESYNKYKLVYRALEADIVNSGQKSYISKERIEDFLWEGIKGARQTDVHLIRSDIGKYYEFDPSIERLAKNLRGPFHPGTGVLLCPANLDWNDEAVQERLRRGEESVGPDTLFYFMYSDYAPVPTALNRGLLRSDILVTAYKAVFFGPSAATASPNRTESKATKSGNAVLGGITKVTPAAIAYIACLVSAAPISDTLLARSQRLLNKVRFSLSAETSLTPGAVHGFDNCGFYRAIVSMLESAKPSAVRQRWRTELLQWWNARCFPRTHAPTTSHVISLQDMLLAQEEEQEEEEE